MTRPDRQHLHSAGGWCSLAAGNRGFCPGGIVKLAEHVAMPARWRVIRRYGRSYAIHPNRINVFASASHAAAIAYADRLAREEDRP